MPALHRYLGNPVLSSIGRLLFQCQGRRLPLRPARLRPRRRRVARPAHHGHGVRERDGGQGRARAAGGSPRCRPCCIRDGRGRPPHLRSWRDGWRHLRFLLLFSPRWLFLYPGLALLALGTALATALYFAPLRIGGAGLDIHSMLYASVGRPARAAALPVRAVRARLGAGCGAAAAAAGAGKAAGRVDPGARDCLGGSAP